MFIKSVKDYILKNSYYFKDIEIKHFYEVKDSKLAALTITINDLNIDAYDYLVEAIGECIINEGATRYNLYLVSTIAPMYEELDDIATARVGFKILNNNYAN